MFALLPPSVVTHTPTSILFIFKILRGFGEFVIIWKCIREYCLFALLSEQLLEHIFQIIFCQCFLESKEYFIQKYIRIYGNCFSYNIAVSSASKLILANFCSFCTGNGDRGIFRRHLYLYQIISSN